MHIDAWRSDLRYAGRALFRRPGFAFVVAATLALGLGVNSAVFALVDAVLLRPLPYVNPARLVFIWQTLPEHGVFELETTPADYAAWRGAHSFGGVSLIASGNFTLTGGDSDPERVRGARTTASLMPLLGITPRMGRAFGANEDTADAPPVVILSDRLWRWRYGAAPAVIGRSIDVDGRPHTVVGVMPPAAMLPGPLAGSDDLWLPKRMSAAERTNTVSHNYTAIGRLAESVSLTEAEAEMDTWAANAAREDAPAHTGLGARVVSIEEDTVRPVRPALLMLMGAVGLLLIIAAANVSTLLIARASGRQREIAVRSALGASFGRLLSLAITECVLLAAAGGLGGLALGTVALRWMRPWLPESLPRLSAVHIDARVGLATVVVSIALGTVLGVVVAAHRGERALGRALASGTRASGSRSAARTRSVLVTIQVAMSVVLLASAGLMIRSVVRLQNVEPGFAADHVLTFRLALPATRYASMQARSVFVGGLLEGLRSLPGVSGAAVNSRLPLGGSRGANGVEIEGRPPAAGERLIADQREVSPAYFAALKIPLLAGRVFTGADEASSAPVTIINHTMAMQFFPGGDAIGRRVRVTAGQASAVAWSYVVGIVGDVHHTGLARPAVAEMYRPYAQTPVLDFGVVVRTAGPPEALAPPARARVQAIDALLPVYDIRTMEERIAASVADRRATALLLLVTAALAASLAAVAIYGSIWYSVMQRIPEIGIRLALGAPPKSIGAQILFGALAVTMAGAAIGTAASLAAAPILQSLLFETPAADPITYAFVFGALIVLTAAASLIPVRRAVRVDPMIALRSE